MQDVNTGKEACLLLEKKLAFFGHYLSATEQMQAALSEKDESSLKRLVSKRQDLINKIDKIDLAIKKILPTSPDKHNLISDKFKEMIAGYFRKLKSIMDTLEPLNQNLTAMVRLEGESTRTDLLGKQRVRQAMKGYRSFNKNPAKFLDTRR